MKKILRAIIIVVLLISLTACAEKMPVQITTYDTDISVTDTETKHITEALTDRETETETKTETETQTQTQTEEALTTGTPETSSPAETEPVEDELSEQQKNSIAMLNYLSMLSQEINASKNSRLFMEEAYASLINNTRPERVNELTEKQLSKLLDVIEEYRMINVRRDRLQYYYEQSRANALIEAIPNPLTVLRGVGEVAGAAAGGPFSIKKIADQIVKTEDFDIVFDSIKEYITEINELKQEYILHGWALSDEEAENLHEIRKNGFLYMIEIVRDNNLPGDFALSEKAIEDFVTWKNKTNIEQRIHFLETEEKTYKMFAYYWLELANSYYEHGDYRKCIDAFKKYEKTQYDIFRKDYYLARSVPNVISAALLTMNDNEYIPFALEYLQKLIDNTDNSDWSLRYFAAQVYLGLYGKTYDLSYLKKAYDLALSNVNYLVDEQRRLNTTYLNNIIEIKINETATKEESNQIKSYNKFLKEQRKTELPPVYAPLQLNCELLFALASEIGLTKAEKDRISGILRDAKNPDLFLTDTLDAQFSLEKTSVQYEAEYNKNSFTIPAACVSQLSKIKVTVTDGGKSITYRDWTVDSVERKTSNFADFTVTYSSNDIKNQTWSEGSTVKVSIYDKESDDKPSIELNFKVSKYTSVPVFGWDWNITFEQIK